MFRICSRSHSRYRLCDFHRIRYRDVKRLQKSHFTSDRCTLSINGVQLAKDFAGDPWIGCPSREAFLFWIGTTTNLQSWRMDRQLHGPTVHCPRHLLLTRPGIHPHHGPICRGSTRHNLYLLFCLLFLLRFETSKHDIVLTDGCADSRISLFSHSFHLFFVQFGTYPSFQAVKLRVWVKLRACFVHATIWHISIAFTSLWWTNLSSWTVSLGN